jgi:L-lactate dehydrogenase complex protein LldG
MDEAPRFSGASAENIHARVQNPTKWKTAMSGAREAILKAAAAALPSRRLDSAAIAAEARALLGEPQAIRPPLVNPSVIGSFVQRVASSKVGAAVDRIPSIDRLPEAIAQHLAARKLPGNIALQPTPALTALDWARAGLSPDGTVDGGVAVSMACWGVAETGSLVVHSAADMPILLNFLPAAHVIAVHASTIVPHLEDYANAAREAGDPAPRNACLITGASGTTDIEGNLVLGAHGPRELHVIVIGDAAAETRA